MNDEMKKTIRLVRRGKLGTDERGRNVWTGDVEPCELELVSTAQLQRIISSSDERRKDRLRKAADGKDGVLAHDIANDRFEIIDDEDLKAALESVDNAQAERRPAEVVYEPVTPTADIDELSLVSTMALRRMLGHQEEQSVEETPVADEGGGFDPYNSG